MKKNTGGVRFGAICLGLAVCVLGGRCARAQNALGDGHALDRNLRTDSGGRNSNVRDITSLIRFNNSVVTGNAMGGKAFRGNTGYRATDDFRGALGSDALFNFRRDAAPAAVPVIAGIRGTEALRYQFALTTGQAPPPAFANLPDFSSGLTRGANPYTPGVNTSVEQRVTSGTVSSALRSTADYGAQQTLQPTIVGYRTLTDGRQSVLTASPLLGVSEFRLGSAAGATPEADAATRQAPASLSGLEAVPAYIPSPLGLVDSMATSRVDTRVEAPKAVSDQFKRALEQANRKPAESPPGATPLPGREPSSADPARPAWELELERIRKQLGGELPETPDPGAAPGEPKDGADVGVPKRLSLEDLVSPQTGKMDIEVLKALQATRPVLVSLVDPERKALDTYAAHMSRGEALLSEARFFDAEDAFTRALAQSPMDPLASVGRVHAEIGAGLFLSAAANLKAFFAEQPTMIGTRYGPKLTPSLGRATSLSTQLRTIIATPTSGMGREAGMLLAYIGYQRSDAAQVKEGLQAMADKTYPDQTSEVVLLALLQKIWVEGKDAPPVPPATPAPPAAVDEQPAVAPKADENK